MLSNTCIAKVSCVRSDYIHRQKKRSFISRLLPTMNDNLRKFCRHTPSLFTKTQSRRCSGTRSHKQLHHSHWLPLLPSSAAPFPAQPLQTPIMMSWAVVSEADLMLLQTCQGFFRHLERLEHTRVDPDLAVPACRLQTVIADPGGPALYLHSCHSVTKY